MFGAWRRWWGCLIDTEAFGADAARMRKTLAVIVVLLAGCGFASAQGYHYRQGYVTKDGTAVQGGYQTNPNGSVGDNWSTRGNYNPFTGQPGTVNPYKPPTYTPYVPYTPKKNW